jgi:hypothetical protein
MFNNSNAPRQIHEPAAVGDDELCELFVAAGLGCGITHYRLVFVFAAGLRFRPRGLGEIGGCSPILLGTLSNILPMRSNTPPVLPTALLIAWIAAAVANNTLMPSPPSQ